MTRTEILEKAIDTYGIDAQEDMLFEEMAELQKSVLKLRRAVKENLHDGHLEDLRENLRKEIADVQIMLDQMRLIYGNTKGQEIYKLVRLQKRLDGAE